MSGGSLADAFRRPQVFPMRRALEIALDAARGLAYLHHRWVRVRGGCGCGTEGSPHSEPTSPWPARRWGLPVCVASCDLSSRSLPVPRLFHCCAPQEAQPHHPP